MKQLLLLSMVFLNMGCALASPPSTKFSVRAVDAESGTPVSNAFVKTGFTLKHDPWGTGKGKSILVEESVNSEGLVAFEGNTVWNERGGHVYAEGYYSHIFSMRYTKNHALNRWEPWNPMIVVKMRPIKNPLPMVIKRVESLKIPKWDVPLRFDFEKGDWVAPYGTGKQTDFIVNMVRRFEHSGDFDAVATITFPNEGDGIQLYKIPEEFNPSEFKFPYEAPANSYQEKLVLERHATLRETKCNFDPKADNYIFRVRTKMDEDGNIISANYGRMGRIEIGWGEVFDTSYWFNPDPHSRSLESDKKPY